MRVSCNSASVVGAVFFTTGAWVVSGTVGTSSVTSVSGSVTGAWVVSSSCGVGAVLSSVKMASSFCWTRFASAAPDSVCREPAVAATSNTAQAHTAAAVR